MKAIANAPGPGYAELELGARGVAIVDFGVGGASDAMVAITGQAGITAAHVPHAEISAVATADHSADEHRVEEIYVCAGAVTPGVGFPVYARTGNVELFGRFSVAWSWG